MAIALDSTSSLLVNGGGVSVSAAFVNTAGTYLVLCFGYSAAATHAPFSATYGGVSMTNRIATENAAGNTASIIFTLATPSLGSNTLAVTWDGVSVNRFVNVYSFTGVDSLDTAIGNTLGGGTGTITQAITIANNNEWIIDSAVNNNTNAMTPGVSQTHPLGGNATAGATDFWSSTKENVSAGANTVSWTASGFSQPAYSTIALVASAGGTPTPLRMRMGMGT